MAARGNRKWTREETVLAYSVFKANGQLSRVDPKVVSLSSSLRKLAEDRGDEISPSFRNPAGCAMKLSHFQYIATGGATGLSSVAAMDKEVIARYEHDEVGLELDSAIAAAGGSLQSEELPAEIPAGYDASSLGQTTSATLQLATKPQITGTPIVQPALKPLGEMLKNDAPFTIPRYQRSYSWEDDEVLDTARDVRALAVGVSKGESPQHFFGGVVLVQDPGAGGWNVIDGQQRLTTFLIATSLLARAFDVLARRADHAGDTSTSTAATQNATSLRNDFLWISRSDPLTGTLEKRPRLSPTPVDHAAFCALLEGSVVVPTRDSHELLQSASTMLWKELISPVFALGGTESDRLRALLTIQYALFNSSIVIQLTASNLQAAYKLFMVLNDRGMQLTEGDLLRAESLEALEGYSSEQSAAASAWDEILSFPGATVQSFLRTFYPSVVGERADIWELVRDYRNRIFKLTTPLPAKEAGRVRQLVEQMRDEIQTFDRIVRGEWPYASSTLAQGQTNRLKRLVKTLKHELAHPLLLAAATALDEHGFLDVVITLERFAFRFKNIGGGHPDAAARIYYPQASALRSDKKWKIDTLRTALANLSEATLATVDIDAALIRQLRYDKPGQRNNVRWLLAALEDFHGWLTTEPGKRSAVPTPDTSVVVDADAATIDHIYPQSADDTDLDPDLETVKHRLGNLTLLEAKDNSIAGNTPFANKKPLYRKSAVRETSKLGRKQSWTAARVTEREHELVKGVTDLLGL